MKWDDALASFLEEVAMFLLIGAVVVLGSVLGGYLMHGGALLVLNQPSEFLIIGGAAVGSLLISTPVRVLRELMVQLKRFVSPPRGKRAYLELLAMLYDVFKQIQHGGVMSMESHVDDPEKSAILSKYPGFLATHHARDFMMDSMKVMIVGGIPAHDLEALMEEDLHVHHEEAAKPAATLLRTADALPGLGIVAAVLGVVITMGSIDGSPAEIGHKVAAALIGTFLGIFLGYGFVQPVAINLEHLAADEGRYAQCIKAGLLATYKGLPPAIAVEFARRVLPTELRPTFDETEKACKGLRSIEPAAAAA